MRKVTEYQEQAENCRVRAANAAGEQEKKRLEEMAAVWGQLARTRQKQLENADVEPVF
jgi:hypothetical protein